MPMDEPSQNEVSSEPSEIDYEQKFLQISSDSELSIADIETLESN